MRVLDGLHVLHADHLADHAGVDHRLEFAEVRRVAQHVAHTHDAAAGLRRGQDLPTFGLGGGDGLFQQHVVAQRQRTQAGRGVQLVGPVAMITASARRGESNTDSQWPQQCARRHVVRVGDALHTLRIGVGDADDLHLLRVLQREVGVDRTAVTGADEQHRHRPCERAVQRVRVQVLVQAEQSRASVQLYSMPLLTEPSARSSRRAEMNCRKDT